MNQQQDRALCLSFALFGMVVTLLGWQWLSNGLPMDGSQAALTTSGIFDKGIAIGADTRPHIDSVTPVGGPQGTSIIIKGRNFSTDPNFSNFIELIPLNENNLEQNNQFYGGGSMLSSNGATIGPVQIPGSVFYDQILGVRVTAFDYYGTKNGLSNMVTFFVQPTIVSASFNQQSRNLFIQTNNAFPHFANVYYRSRSTDIDHFIKTVDLGEGTLSSQINVQIPTSIPVQKGIGISVEFTATGYRSAPFYNITGVSGDSTL